VLNKLDQSRSRTQNELSTINAEIGEIQSKEKLILNKLSQSLGIIVKNKSKANSQFQQQAVNFNVKMADATQKVVNEHAKVI